MSSHSDSLPNPGTSNASSRSSAHRHDSPTHCQWCGKELNYAGRGRKPRFCSQSCKQRAYEQRRGGRDIGISDDAIILRGDKAQLLMDSLFELRCAAEDVETAVTEGAEPAEVTALTSELVAVAKSIESIRTSIRD